MGKQPSTDGLLTSASKSAHNMRNATVSITMETLAFVVTRIFFPTRIQCVTITTTAGSTSDRNRVLLAERQCPRRHQMMDSATGFAKELAFSRGQFSTMDVMILLWWCMGANSAERNERLCIFFLLVVALMNIL